MKRILVLLCLVMSLTACAPMNTDKVYEEKDEPQKSMFVEVEQTNAWKIVYHRDTKVMYAVSFGGYNCGTFTLLVDKTGNPMLYEEN